MLCRSETVIPGVVPVWFHVVLRALQRHPYQISKVTLLRALGDQKPFLNSFWHQRQV